ncbi:MAG: BamA/TamA family outer membrane protein [Bacteroidales bacterium]|nr:BamA/TamA family outer membrane protein [Bacteroidales bacterium]
MKLIKNIISKAVLAFGIIVIVLSFDSCKSTKHVADDEYLLAKVNFDIDNSNVDLEDLKTTLKQKPNRKTLSVFRFHLMVYNLAKSGKERKFKNKIADVIGEPPVIYDEFATTKTVSDIEAYLHAQSYYEAEVKLTEKKRKKKINLTYIIETGKPYIVSNLVYDIVDPKIKELVLLDTVNSLLSTNINFNTDELQDERERLVRMLKSNGYYYFSINNIHFYADTTINKYQTKLTLAIRKSFEENDIKNNTPFKAQVIRNIYIYPDHDPKLSISDATDYNLTLDTIYVDGYNIIYSNKLEFKPSVFLQSCFVKRGDRYNIKNIEKTHAHLSNLKQFKLINIKLNPAEDVFLETQKERFLDLHIYLTPMLKQSYTLELEGNNTSGNIGMEGGISYNNKNLLRGAQLFNIKGSLAFQTLALDTEDTRQLLFNTLEYGGAMKLNIPKLMIPFYENYEFVKNHNPKTRISTSFNYQQRPDYTRTIGNLSFGYFWKGGKNNYITHSINPIDLYLVKIFDFDPTFQEQIANLYIRYSYEDQLMSVISYDLMFNNQNINKLKSFSYFWLNLETSGNIPNVFYKLTNQEQVEGAYQFVGVEFAQFVKADFDYRYYQIFNEKQSLVYRAFFGIGLPYGNSTKGLPFIKKYFIGGANDIRAYRVRSIGPGAYTNPDSNYDQIADMKIMFNLEYRFKIISFLEGALFIDAGNIWAIDSNDNRAGALFNANRFYKEMALGTGFGTRLDFSFFIIRFDFGVPLYSPVFPIGERWLGTFNTFEFSDFTFNFGIGYPF